MVSWKVSDKIIHKMIHNQALAIIRLSAYNYILIQFEERTAEYMSAPQAAEKWGISERRVQIFCSKKRIPGVSKLGYMWLIPKDFAATPFAMVVLSIRK